MALPTSINRRDFLKLAGKGFLVLSGILGAGGLAGYVTYQDQAVPPAELDLGAASNYPTGSRTLIPEANAILIHAPDGFRALSLTCTHLGCTVKQVAGGFACPCHNSQFDANGKVMHGPATKPLTALKVKEEPNGSLLLSRI
jgi:Rieske Fe-S protein